MKHTPYTYRCVEMPLYMFVQMPQMLFTFRDGPSCTFFLLALYIDHMSYMSYLIPRLSISLIFL
jgi:hypothetical protein